MFDIVYYLFLFCADFSLIYQENAFKMSSRLGASVSIRFGQSWSWSSSSCSNSTSNTCLFFPDLRRCHECTFINTCSPSESCSNWYIFIFCTRKPDSVFLSHMNDHDVARSSYKDSLRMGTVQWISWHSIYQGQICVRSGKLRQCGGWYFRSDISDFIQHHAIRSPFIFFVAGGQSSITLSVDQIAYHSHAAPCSVNGGYHNHPSTGGAHFMAGYPYAPSSSCVPSKWWNNILLVW